MSGGLQESNRLAPEKWCDERQAAARTSERVRQHHRRECRYSHCIAAIEAFHNFDNGRVLHGPSKEGDGCDRGDAESEGEVRKNTNSRNTLAGAVNRAETFFDQLLAADIGVHSKSGKLSNLEGMVWAIHMGKLFQHLIEGIERAPISRSSNSGVSLDYVDRFSEVAEMKGGELQGLLIESIEQLDPAPLESFALAIRKIRKLQANRDPRRWALSLLRVMYPGTAVMTAKDLACAIKDRVVDLSRFRKVLKEMHVPHAGGKRGRPTKNETRKR